MRSVSRAAAAALVLLGLLAGALLADPGDDAPDGGAVRPDGPLERGRVTAVVDGDTVHVRAGGASTTVRLALVDAPESSRLRYGHAECGGAQAARFLRGLVAGREVRLRRPGGEDRDRYGRAVRELVVDERSVDLALLEAGWARPYRVPSRDGGAAANRAARAAADAARRADRGAWALCGGFGRRAD